MEKSVNLKLDPETLLKNNGNSSVPNSQRIQDRCVDEIPLDLDKSRDSSLEETREALKPESKIKSVVISSIEQLKIKDMTGKKTTGNT